MTNLSAPTWTAGCAKGRRAAPSLCAYGFARIRFPGRNFWFIATIASIMLPLPVTLIPLYVLSFNII
jgi:multiple sugar transport system permease protein